MVLTEQIVALRRTLNRMLTRRLAAHTQRPFPQLRLLRAVANGKVETQADAAEHLLVDAATVCRMVDRLEADGVLQRCEGKDRRSVRLAVTEQARPDLQAFHAELDWIDGQLRQHITPAEYETLAKLLRKLQAGLDDPREHPRKADHRAD